MILIPPLPALVFGGKMVNSGGRGFRSYERGGGYCGKDREDAVFERIGRKWGGGEGREDWDGIRGLIVEGIRR